jgi:DNA-damage-inducible protein J
MEQSMSMQSAITAKIPIDEKDAFVRAAKNIGTTPSNAIRMFVVAFNKRGGFPFDPADPYAYNKETMQALDNAITGRNLSGPFYSADDLMADLDD